MPNHPNRGPKGPASNPTPEQIRSMRKEFLLTPAQAAELLYRTERNWQQFECGERRMDPILRDAFIVKQSIGPDEWDRIVRDRIASLKTQPD